MLKSTYAVVLSMALAVTGVNVDEIYNVAASSWETVKDEMKIITEQKEEAKREKRRV